MNESEKVNEKSDTELLDFFEENSVEFKYYRTPSIDGKYPAWTYRKQVFKKLRDAIKEAMGDTLWG